MKTRSGFVSNSSSRKYLREVMEKAVKEYVNEYVVTGRSIGELNHPTTTKVNLDTSFIINVDRSPESVEDLKQMLFPNERWSDKISGNEHYNYADLLDSVWDKYKASKSAWCDDTSTLNGTLVRMLYLYYRYGHNDFLNISIPSRLIQLFDLMYSNKWNDELEIELKEISSSLVKLLPGAFVVSYGDCGKFEAIIEGSEILESSGHVMAVSNH